MVGTNTNLSNKHQKEQHLSPFFLPNSPKIMNLNGIIQNRISGNFNNINSNMNK